MELNYKSFVKSEGREKLNIKAISKMALVAILVVVVIIAGVGAYLLLQPSTPQEDLQVGMVLYGHVDLGSWDPMCASTTLDLESELPIKAVFSEATEIVNAEDVIRNRATTDDLVFISTYIYQDAAIEVAGEFPDTPFVLQQFLKDDVSDLSIFPSNILLFVNEDTFAQTLFLSGVAAGKMTETNKIGLIVPDNSPGSAAMVQSFIAGALYANPDVEATYSIIGAFVDPIKSRDAAASMIEAGADVLWNGMDDESVIEEALSRGVYVTSQYRDTRATYPDTVIAVAQWQLSGWFKEPLESVIDGTWETYWSENRVTHIDFASGGCDVVYGSMVPADTLTYLADVKTQIINGQIDTPFLVGQWP